MLPDVAGLCQYPAGFGASVPGEDFEVFLTGGDAFLVEDMIPGARVMPDLVFIGLAIACPLE